MNRLHRAILRSASLLVPCAARAEWLAEWTAELWYVDAHPTRFCLGAFRDALWLHRNSPAPNAPRGLESPIHCLMWLAVAGAVLVTLALQLRPARNILLSSPYPDARNLTVISRVPFERYEALGGQFTGAAYYRPTGMRLGSADLTVALASPNLFEMLGRGRRAAGPSRSSDAAWRTYFNADPDIVGRPVPRRQIRDHLAVIPNEAWRLPGRIDAWLLGRRRRLPGRSTVHVLARLRDPTRAAHHLICRAGALSIRVARSRHLFVPALAMILVAILLVAITAVPLRIPGRSLPAPVGLSRREDRLAGAASGLRLARRGRLPRDGLPNRTPCWPARFSGCDGLLDQRNRCPVCLPPAYRPHPDRRRVAARSSKWYGTELVCVRGHGLLYIGDSSSSYWAHRWQYLDPSWNGLFSCAGAPRVRSRYG